MKAKYTWYFATCLFHFRIYNEIFHNYEKEKVKVLLLNCLWLFATPWTVVSQAPLSMEILQAEILEWVAVPFSKGSLKPRDRTQISCIAGGFFTVWANREAQLFKLFFFFFHLMCDTTSRPGRECHSGPSWHPPEWLWAVNSTPGFRCLIPRASQRPGLVPRSSSSVVVPKDPVIFPSSSP